MKNKLAIIIGSLIFVAMIVFYVLNADFSPKTGDKELIEKIERLETKIDSLNVKKDSIRTVIDSTHIKIITNEKHYQERINIVIHQSYSEDSSFVTDYIRQFADQNPQYNLN